MSTLLVTGGCGFIGSTLIRLILRERPNDAVVNFDALTYCGNQGNLKGAVEEAEEQGRYRFIHADVRDQASVTNAIKGCDAILHLAAETHVDRSISDGRVFFETNALGTQTLLEAAHRSSDFNGPIVLASTDEVYGSLPTNEPDRKFTESDPLNPSSPYAASKAAADLAAIAMRRTFGTDIRIIRGANTYGPRQFPEKIIPLFVTRLAKGERVPLYGDGSAIRDWMHAEDHAHALLAALDIGQPGGIYNAAAHNERTNLDLTHKILEIMGFDEDRVERVADRPGHDMRYAMRTDRIERELGWRPTVTDFDRALTETVRWYINQSDQSAQHGSS